MAEDKADLSPLQQDQLSTVVLAVEVQDVMLQRQILVDLRHLDKVLLVAQVILELASPFQAQAVEEKVA
jgi:hypothetical protein